MDVDECIEQAELEEMQALAADAPATCSCGLGEGYGWKNHVQECPVSIEGRKRASEPKSLSKPRRETAWAEQERKEQERGPLTAAEAVKKKLAGRPPA
jgi:hypothetical protein